MLLGLPLRSLAGLRTAAIAAAAQMTAADTANASVPVAARQFWSLLQSEESRCGGFELVFPAPATFSRHRALVAHLDPRAAEILDCAPPPRYNPLTDCAQ